MKKETQPSIKVIIDEHDGKSSRTVWFVSVVLIGSDVGFIKDF